MGSTLVYNRSSITAPKSRQQIRLTATVAAPAATDAANCEGPFGDFFQAWTQSANIWVAWAAHAALAFQFVNQIIAGGASEPHLCVTSRGWLLLVYTRDNGDGTTDVMSCWSYDDGQTFDTPGVIIEGGKHGFCAVGLFDTVAVAAYVAGAIVCTIQEPGDATSGIPFHFQDDNHTDLAVADDQFSFQQGQENPAPWVLVCTISGESATSRWRSWDDGGTWQRAT